MIFDKKIKLGVTGFSRTGKTVFIGALSQALLTADTWSRRRNLGPLSQFEPFERETFQCASIRDDVHSYLPQFPFRNVRDSMAGTNAQWPVPTEGISHLVMQLDCIIPGKFWNHEKKIELDLIDYPGEWLADFPMLQQNYHAWSEQSLERACQGQRKKLSELFFDELNKVTPDNDDEELISSLTECWEQYLQQAADSGLVLNQPGRLLRPDNLRHSPVLRLIPLPEKLRDGTLGKKLESRFGKYKEKVITPFYKNYFSNIDRQIVLIDILRTLKLGKEAYNELLEALRGVLEAFRYGKGGFFDWLKGHNTTHLLFAATKADHVVRGDRANLEKMLQKMVRKIDDDNRLKSSVNHYKIMEIASVQATEDRMTIKAPKREVLFGKPYGQQHGAWDPGGLPLDLPPDWATLGFEFYQFEPGHMPDAINDGFPSINLGKALNFLIGEDLM